MLKLVHLTDSIFIFFRSIQIFKVPIYLLIWGLQLSYILNVSICSKYAGLICIPFYYSTKKCLQKHLILLHTHTCLVKNIQMSSWEKMHFISLLILQYACMYIISTHICYWCIIQNKYSKYWNCWIAQCAETQKKDYFGRTVHCLPQRIKSMFLKKFRVKDPRREPGVVKKKFLKSWS